MWGSGNIAPSLVTSELGLEEPSASRSSRSPAGLLSKKLGGPRVGLETIEKRKILHAGNGTRAFHPLAVVYVASLFRLSYSYSRFWKYFFELELNKCKH